MTKKVKILGTQVSLAFVSLVSLLAIATVVLAIESSAKGAVLASLENKRMALEKENRQLKDNLVAATSLTNVEVVALEAGLIKPERIIYLNLGEPVASLQ